MTFLDLYFMLAGYFLSSSYQQEVNYYLYQVFLLKGLKQEYGQIFFWFQFWIDHSFICPYLVDINSYILCGVFFFILYDPDTREVKEELKLFIPFFLMAYLYILHIHVCSYLVFFFLTSFLQMLLGEFRWISRVLLGFGRLYYFSALLCARVGLERRSNQLKLCFYIYCCCFGAKTRGLIEF